MICGRGLTEGERRRRHATEYVVSIQNPMLEKRLQEKENHLHGGRGGGEGIVRDVSASVVRPVFVAAATAILVGVATRTLFSNAPITAKTFTCTQTEAITTAKVRG